MQILAIDLGTSFIKGGILDLESTRISHIQRRPFPNPLPGLPPRHFEVDPQAVVAATGQLIDTLLEAAPDCAGVMMCTQMHGVVLVDRVGRALSNLVTWQDQRALDSAPGSSGTYLEGMFDVLEAEEIQVLGNELRPGLPVCYLFWLAQRGELPEVEAQVTCLPDYVAGQLCGQVPKQMETTNAAACGGLDLRSLDWHGPALEKLGIHELVWPDVRPFGFAVGHLAGHDRSIPVYSPVGDQQCALAGAFLGADELSLNIATGAQASLITSSATFGDYQTRPYFQGYLNTITHIPAGRALNALVDLFTELATAQGIELPAPWAVITARVDEVPATDLQVNLAFYGTGLLSEGAITNIRGDNLSVGHLFRGALDNMAAGSSAAARRLDAGEPWRRVIFSGGLPQRWPELRRSVETPFHRESRLAASSEDTLLGLMVLGMAACGQVESVAQATELLLQRQAAGDSFV